MYVLYAENEQLLHDYENYLFDRMCKDTVVAYTGNC
jgi:hypothetical protein